MELKQNTATILERTFEVLIVPFMELKPNTGDYSAATNTS